MANIESTEEWGELPCENFDSLLKVPQVAFIINVSLPGKQILFYIFTICIMQYHNVCITYF